MNIVKFPIDPIYNVIPKDHREERMTILEELEDELMRGKIVGKIRGMGVVDLAFVLDGEYPNVAALLIADKEARQELIEDWEEQARKSIRHFLEHSPIGEGIVADRQIDRITNNGMDREDEP